MGDVYTWGAGTPISPNPGAALERELVTHPRLEGKEGEARRSWVTCSAASRPQPTGFRGPSPTTTQAACQVLRARGTRCALGSFRRNHDSWAGSTEGLRGLGRVRKASQEVRSV